MMETSRRSGSDRMRGWPAHRPLLVGALLAGLVAAGTIAAAADPAGPTVVAQAQGARPAAGAANPAPTDSALRQRVEQLEEQLVDMQVVVGTLESLARGGQQGGSSTVAGGGYSGGADSVRLDGLETQVRALAAQIQQLTDQVRSLGGQPRRSDAGPPPTSGAAPADLAAAPPADVARFGSTTITAAEGDAIGGLIENGAGNNPPPAPAQPAGGSAAAPAAPAAAPAAPGFEMTALPPAFGAAAPPADTANAKQLYETAYGYLMQRDYGAAQTAFEDFLSRYPQDSLAGNAQYWLGEAHFVRGEYKAAAGSFLRGYRDYAGNARAADSLLKLAMSLDRLGQKAEACSSFAELSSRFPNAPENVKSRAKSERQRIGCS